MLILFGVHDLAVKLTGSDIRDRCDSALDRLRRVRAGLATPRGSREFKKEVGVQFGRAFLPGKRRKEGQHPHSKSKQAKTTTYTHRFVCLSKCNQEAIPTTDREKDALLEAGLGEKKVVILK